MTYWVGTIFGTIQKSDLQQPPKFKQFWTILAIFFQILTIFFATHHHNWFWSTTFSYKTQIFSKNCLSEFYEAVAPNFGWVNCLNFGGCWRSNFWIFPKNNSIDLLSRSLNATCCYFFWIGEIANLSIAYTCTDRFGSTRLARIDSINSD